MHRTSLFLIPWFASALAAQSAPQLVADLRPGAPDPAAASDPGGFVDIGGRVVFHADDPRHGRELWVTDGTPQGTTLVVDLRPGADDALHFAAPLIDFGTFAVFGCLDAQGSALYRTDGTPSGTRRLARLQSIAFFDPETFFFDGTRLWFTAMANDHGEELWITDGTSAGTREVIDLGPGRTNGAPTGTITAHRAIYQGRLYFTGNDGVAGEELWSTDGTAAGTQLVADVVPGAAGSRPQALIELNGRLMFATQTTQPYLEWWSTDGTAVGTQRVSGWPVNSVRRGTFATIGSRLLFIGLGQLEGAELFVTDGTAAGTGPLVDIYPGIRTSDLNGLTAWNGAIWFVANDGTNGQCLWRTDGTAAGTTLAVDLVPGSSGGFQVPLIPTPNGLVFVGRDAPTSSAEPWLTDGTRAGTFQIADIRPGSGTSAPRQLTAVGAEVWFGASDGVSGIEPWRTIGSGRGAVQVADVAVTTRGSDPGPRAASTGFATTFAATDDVAGREPRITDGTPAGTRLFRDFAPGIRQSPDPAVRIDGDRAYWSVGTQLFTTDVFGNDFQLLATAGVGAAFGGELQRLGGELFFAGGTALWATDGTPAGTRQIVDLAGLFYPIGPRNLRAANDRLFFLASPGTLGQAGMFVSDGTAAGTRLLVPGAFQLFGSDRFGIEVLGNGVVLQSANAVWAEFELWQSDGLSATRIARLGNAPNTDPGLFPVGGRLVLAAADAAHGAELWVTDGTAAGTGRLADVRPGPVGSTPSDFTPAGGLLFFTADDGTHGRELWVTDGTAAGTRLVADAVAGPLGVDPQHLLALGTAPAVAFRGTDGTGRELWASDGTTAGTRRLTDLAPGGRSSDATPLAVQSGWLLFTADDGRLGQELWRLPLSDTAGHVARTVGAGCAGVSGSSPTAGFAGAPRLGDAGFALTLAGARPAAAAGLLLDFAVAPVTLPQSCTLWVPTAPIAIGVATTPAGTATLGLPVANDPALPGLELFGQWLVADAGGALGGALSASGAIAITFGR